MIWVLRIVSLAAKLAALAALALLAWRSDLVADASWDSLAYHLPFAAFRAGFLDPDNFVLPAHLIASLEGFPSGIYRLKGALWLWTGRAESVQWVSILSVLIFVAYAVRALRLPLEWVVFGVLAIPVVQIGASANGTDVASNMGLAMLFLSVYRLAVEPHSVAGSDLLWLIIACLVASGSKPQGMVVGCVLYGVFLGLFLVQGWRGVLSIPRRSAVIGLAVAGIAISYPAFDNLVRHGNPIYPMKVEVAGMQLPGVFSAGAWSEPAHLNMLPQPQRWLLSVLESHAFDQRAVPYSEAQGDVPHSALSFRMGGYFAPLILLSVFVLLWTNLRRRGTLLGLVVWLTVTLFVSWLPGSNELRYYSFWAISLVAIALLQLESGREEPVTAGAYVLYCSFLLTSFVYVGYITGWAYFCLQGNQFDKLVTEYWRQPVVTRSTQGTIYCYADDYRGAIFDSAAFGDASNRIVVDNRGCGETR